MLGFYMQNILICSAFLADNQRFEGLRPDSGMVEQDRSNDCRADCFGAWGGSATQDKCGVCMHVAATAMSGRDACLDCGGVVFGGSAVDNCGTCDSNRTNDCDPDCEGVWGGSKSRDDCGVCGGKNEICADCAGTAHGPAVRDACGVCDPVRSPPSSVVS